MCFFYQYFNKRRRYRIHEQCHCINGIKEEDRVVVGMSTGLASDCVDYLFIYICSALYKTYWNVPFCFRKKLGVTVKLVDLRHFTK